MQPQPRGEGPDRFYRKILAKAHLREFLRQVGGELLHVEGRAVGRQSHGRRSFDGQSGILSRNRPPTAILQRTKLVRQGQTAIFPLPAWGRVRGDGATPPVRRGAAIQSKVDATPF